MFHFGEVSTFQGHGSVSTTTVLNLLQYSVNGTSNSKSDTNNLAVINKITSTLNASLGDARVCICSHSSLL